MSFLYDRNSILYCGRNSETKQKNQKTKRPSPTSQGKLRSLARGFLMVLTQNVLGNIKRTSVSASRFFASMTVEAALVLPLLLFFCLNLLSSVEMVRLHGNLQSAMWDIGRQMSVYGYVYDQLGDDGQREGIIGRLGGVLLSQTMVKSSVVRDLGEEYLENAPLSYGVTGLDFLESRFMEQGDEIDLVLTYRVSPWADFMGVLPFRMVNRYYSKAWTGYEIPGADRKEGGSEEDSVYVTEHGTVYHESLQCSYLKRVITVVPFREISGTENSQGKDYQLCERCRGRQAGDLVYVTSTGDKYHYALDCPALKRTVREIPRKEAAGMYAPCSRCAGQS